MIGRLIGLRHAAPPDRAWLRDEDFASHADLLRAL